jgi:hypothetical protein
MAEQNPTSLDAERERLRKAGYTDAEISKYFIERLHAGSQQSPAAAPTQGTMTGVLGNASAVLSHAKGTIPVIQSNIANVADPAASPSSRARSTAVLALVAVIVAVLGYAIYQEWTIHIINAAAISRAETQAKTDTFTGVGAYRVPAQQGALPVRPEDQAEAERIAKKLGLTQCKDGHFRGTCPN